MAVNIFGQSPKQGVESLEGKRGDRGVGFHLTQDNQFALQHIRLTNVADAVDAQDAATLSQVTTNVTLMQQQLDYVKTNAMSVENGAYSAKRKRITEIAVPNDDYDAANKLYIERNYLGLNDEKTAYEAQSKRICKVAAPTEPSDVATKQFVQDTCPSLITFQATSPLDANAYFHTHFLVADHIVTGRAILLKAALYCSDVNSTIVVLCHIGNASFPMNKAEGELSTKVTYHTPKVIEKDSRIRVHTADSFAKEGVTFQLDLYIVNFFYFSRSKTWV